MSEKEVAKVDGWIWKKCPDGFPGFHFWQKRWFVLNAQCILYYKTQTSKTPNGAIPLSSIVEAKREVGSKMGRFNLVLDQRRRIYMLRTEEDAEAAKWVEQISSLIAKSPALKNQAMAKLVATLQEKDKKEEQLSRERANTPLSPLQNMIIGGLMSHSAKNKDADMDETMLRACFPNDAAVLKYLLEHLHIERSMNKGALQLKRHELDVDLVSPRTGDPLRRVNSKRHIPEDLSTKRPSGIISLGLPPSSSTPASPSPLSPKTPSPEFTPSSLLSTSFSSQPTLSLDSSGHSVSETISIEETDEDEDSSKKNLKQKKLAKDTSLNDISKLDHIAEDDEESSSSSLSTTQTYIPSSASSDSTLSGSSIAESLSFGSDISSGHASPDQPLSPLLASSPVTSPFSSPALPPATSPDLLVGSPLLLSTLSTEEEPTREVSLYHSRIQLDPVCSIKGCDLPVKQVSGTPSEEHQYCDVHQELLKKEPSSEPSMKTDSDGDDLVVIADDADEDFEMLMKRHERARAQTRLVAKPVVQELTVRTDSKLMEALLLVFQTSDDNARGLAVRVLWFILQTPAIQRVSKRGETPAETFAGYIQKYCSGKLFSRPIANSLFAILVSKTQEFISDTESDKLESASLRTLIQNQEVWQATFMALHATDFKIREATLKEINTLLIENSDNCQSLSTLNRWQQWIWPLLRDLPLSDGLESNRLVYHYTMNLFTVVHFDAFRRGSQFVDVFCRSLDILRNYAGENSKSQAVGSLMLSSLVAKITNNIPSVFPPSGYNHSSWENLFALTGFIKRFVFQSYQWRDHIGHSRPSVRTNFVIDEQPVDRGKIFAPFQMATVSYGVQMAQKKCTDEKLINNTLLLFKALKLDAWDPTDASLFGMSQEEKDSYIRGHDDFDFFRDAKDFLLIVSVKANQLHKPGMMQKTVQNFVLAKSHKERKQIFDKMLSEQAPRGSTLASATLMKLKRNSTPRVEKAFVVSGVAPAFAKQIKDGKDLDKAHAEAKEKRTSWSASTTTSNKPKMAVSRTPQGGGKTSFFPTSSSGSRSPRGTAPASFFFFLLL